MLAVPAYRQLGFEKFWGSCMDLEVSPTFSDYLSGDSEGSDVAHQLYIQPTVAIAK